MAPSDKCLVGDELEIFLGILSEFVQGGRCGIKVGAESGKKYVEEFWVSVAGFGTRSGGGEDGGVPAAAGDGLALE